MSLEDLVEEEEAKIFHYTVECINISKSIGLLFKKPVLRNVTLNIPQGVFGIVGPRGSGISTLLKIIAGVMSPNTGKARVLGYDMSTEFLKAKRLIGYVPQRIHVSKLTFEEDTGKEFLIHQGMEKGMSPYDAEERAIIVAKRLGFQRYLDVDLDKYTDAMKHLLLVGAAIMHDPQVLILDEPFINYDYRTVNRIIDVIQQYKSERRTVIIGTAFLPDVLTLADEVAILLQARDAKGRPLGGVIVFQGKPHQLLKKVNPNRFKIGVSELDLMLEAIIQEETVLEAYIEKRARSALRGTRGMLNRGIIAVTVSDYKVFWKVFRDMVHEYGAIVDYYNTIPPLERVFAKDLERIKIAGPLMAQRAEVVRAAWEELGKGNLLKAAKLFFKAADLSARLGEEDREGEYRREAEYLMQKGKQRQRAALVEKKGIIEERAEALIKAEKYDEAARLYDIAAEIAHELGDEEEAMRLRAMAEELRARREEFIEKRKQELMTEKLRKMHLKISEEAEKAFAKGNYYHAAFLYEKAAEVAEKFNPQLADEDRKRSAQIRGILRDTLQEHGEEMLTRLTARIEEELNKGRLKRALGMMEEAAMLAEDIGDSARATALLERARELREKLEAEEKKKELKEVERKDAELRAKIQQLVSENLFSEAAQLAEKLADLWAPHDSARAEEALKLKDELYKKEKEYQEYKRRAEREKELKVMLKTFAEQAKKFEESGELLNAAQMWYRVAEIFELLGDKTNARKANIHADKLKARWEKETSVQTAQRAMEETKQAISMRFARAKELEEKEEFEAAAEEYEGAYALAASIGDAALMKEAMAAARRAREKAIEKLRKEAEKETARKRAEIEQKVISREEELKKKLPRLVHEAESLADRDPLKAAEKYNAAADIALELGDIGIAGRYRELAKELMERAQMELEKKEEKESEDRGANE